MPYTLEDHNRHYAQMGLGHDSPTCWCKWNEERKKGQDVRPDVRPLLGADVPQSEDDDTGRAMEPIFEL